MKRDIKGYEGLYFVSDLGEVFSYPKKTRKGIRKLKPCCLKTGYLGIDLCKDGIIKKYTIHRLVALAFIENPDNKEQVNHKNGIKTDNSLSNLEWSTRSENQLHSIKSGLRSCKGVKNSQCKLTEDIVLKIFNDTDIYSNIAKKYNISIPTISDIKRKHTWKHITNI